MFKIIGGIVLCGFAFYGLVMYLYDAHVKQ